MNPINRQCHGTYIHDDQHLIFHGTRDPKGTIMITLESRATIRAAAAAAHDAYQHLVLAQNPKAAAYIFEDLSKERQDACIAGAAAILTENLSDEQSHDTWAKHLLAAGWTRGEKIRGRNIHPGLVPYAELDHQLKARNEVFCGVVRLMGHAHLSIPTQ
jgi:hypothetical protein